MGDRDSESLIWISGATNGIGAGLARTCPYPDAEIINLSRSDHPSLPTVRFDLTDPTTWTGVAQHFTERLQQFRGRRAIFVHNAFWYVDQRFAGDGDGDLFAREVTANVSAPLVLGDAFLRAAAPAVAAGVDVGLLLMSSGVTQVSLPGMSVYSAGKSAVEHWVRIVRAERAHRGAGPWVVAVRPGFVDTPATRRLRGQSVENYPHQPAIDSAFETNRVGDPDRLGAQVWAALPPADDQSVLSFAEGLPTE